VTLLIVLLGAAVVLVGLFVAAQAYLGLGPRAAPAPTVRQAPTGIRLKDGWRSLATFSLKTDLCIEEVEVTPGGFTLGTPVDQTTMWNNTYETAAPQALRQQKDVTITFAYDPQAVIDIDAMAGIEQTLTIRYKDGSTLANFGWVNEDDFEPLRRGTQPRGRITWHNSSFDPVGKVEAGPALSSVVGT
jgi:hypothetical protein